MHLKWKELISTFSVVLYSNAIQVPYRASNVFPQYKHFPPRYSWILHWYGKSENFSSFKGGWQGGLEPSLHDRPSWEIWPCETEYHLPSKQIWRGMQIDIEGRFVFARFWVFPRPNIKKRFSRTFLMEFLNIGRRDVWTVHGWLHLSWFGIEGCPILSTRIQLYPLAFHRKTGSLVV